MLQSERFCLQEFLQGPGLLLQVPAERWPQAAPGMFRMQHSKPPSETNTALNHEPQTFGTTGQSATCSDTSTFEGSSVSTESGNHLFRVFVCQYPLNTQVPVPWSCPFVLNTRSKGLLCPRRVSTFTLIRYFIS